MSSKFRILAIAIGVLIVILIILPFLIPVNAFRPTIEDKLAAALGRKVEVGNLSLSLVRGSLTAENLSIADDPKFSHSPFLTAKSLQVGVEMIPLLFSRSLRVTGITIEKPEVTLLRDAAGKWNFSSLGPSTKGVAPAAESPRSTGPSGAAPEFSVQKLDLNDGRITIGSTKTRERSVYDKVTVNASDVSLASAFPVTVTATLPGGGNFKLDGRVGPIDEKDAALSPLDAKLAVNDLNLGRTGAIDASQGLGGLLDLNATLASKDGEALTRGSMKFAKLLLIAGGSPSSVPVAIDFSTRYDLRKSAGVMNPSTVKIGNATAHISGTYETPAESDATVVNLKLEGQNMSARDLEAFLPAVGIHLPRGATLAAGTLNTNLNIKGPTNHLVTDGSVGLYSAKLAGFDLGSKLTAISALAGIRTGSDLEIQQVATNVHMAPDGVRAENFNAIVPALGNLVGAGTIDAKNNLDFKMVATLTAQAASGSPAAAASNALGGLLGQLGGGSKSFGGSRVTRIPFLIEGTTSDPKFVPDVKGLAGAMLKSQFAGLGQSSGANPGQQPNNPLGALGDLFKKKKP